MIDRDQLARYLFENTERWRWLASSEDAAFDEYVERNQEEWRTEADDLLAFIQEPAEEETPVDEVEVVEPVTEVEG